MADRRHAEIAGAGIVGLTAATVLAQRGWSVRVHERNPELREIGAGLTFWPNGLQVLREIGVFTAAETGGQWMKHWALIDERKRTLQAADFRALTFLRTHLHHVLAEKATSAGVEIVTSSLVTGATPEGEVLLANGSRLKADLVVGADGLRSAVRESLGLTRRMVDLHDGCLRHLVPLREGDAREDFTEHWSGSRRLGIVPCTKDHHYIFLCCSAADMAARTDIASWIESFPHCRHLLERISDTAPYNTFYDVIPSRWSSGRGAIVGDAANAMSANLGLAANVGIVNTFSLGQSLDAEPDLQTALKRWEASERPFTDSAQRYSRMYSWIVCRWPRALLDARSALIGALGFSKPVQRRLRTHPATQRVPRILPEGTAVTAR